MKSEAEIKIRLQQEIQTRDALLGQLNAAIGRVQALQAILGIAELQKDNGEVTRAPTQRRAPPPPRGVKYGGK